MSTDTAFPVLHTTDHAEALRVARQLLTIGVQDDTQVSVDVELPTVEEVLRARRALPKAWFRTEDVDDWIRDQSDPTGLHGGVQAPELSVDPGFLSPYLPLWAEMWGRPVGSVEDAFTALVGPHLGEIHWSNLIWPGVPELGLYREVKHAEVSVLFNARDRHLEARADHHTVLVHVRHNELHASWVAEQIGRSVVGPPQRP